MIPDWFYHGGVVMYPLALCSVAGVAFAVAIIAAVPAGAVVAEGGVKDTAAAPLQHESHRMVFGRHFGVRGGQDFDRLIAAEVKEDQECGIRLERFSEFKEGDILEFYDSAIDQ